MQLTSLNDITARHRHIFLSPHFDDVMFSCGGSIGVQLSSGIRPLVITVFAGVPSPDTQLSTLAQQDHRDMGIAPVQGVTAAVEMRRKEDQAAMEFLDLDYLWLDYQDAIYRGSPAYYQTRESLIGGDVNAADLTIDRQLAQDLVDLHDRLPDTSWYAPLGIGRHVDHQLVCSAVDRLVQRSARVYFYEEMPYALQSGTLDARLAELGGVYEPALVEMSEFMAVRLEGSDMYASRLRPDFGGAEMMHRSIEHYSHSIRPVETVHLERFWTPG